MDNQMKPARTTTCPFCGADAMDKLMKNVRWFTCGTMSGPDNNRRDQTPQCITAEVARVTRERDEARAEAVALQERVKRLEEAVAAYQKAYTPDGHKFPRDCFATGPFTGDPIQDIIACPGCWAEQKAKEAKP
jgi:hypothetical protein